MLSLYVCHKRVVRRLVNCRGRVEYDCFLNSIYISARREDDSKGTLGDEECE